MAKYCAYKAAETLTMTQTGIMTLIGSGFLDEHECATIVVDIDMNVLRERVRIVRDFIDKTDFVTCVEIWAPDPVEVSSEHEELEVPANQGCLVPFEGEYETTEEHRLTYARIEITKYGAYYKCSPKSWDATLMLYFTDAVEAEILRAGTHARD